MDDLHPAHIRIGVAIVGACSEDAEGGEPGDLSRLDSGPARGDLGRVPLHRDQRTDSAALCWASEDSAFRYAGLRVHISPGAAARLSYVAAFGAVGAWYPYLAVFFQDRGLDLGLIGLMTALGAAAGLVSAPMWGALADRFAGSPLVIPFAALITAAGATAIALSDSGVGWRPRSS